MPQLSLDPLLGHVRLCVLRQVEQAPLLGNTTEERSKGIGQTGVRVAGGQFHAADAPVHQAPQKGAPVSV